MTRKDYEKIAAVIEGMSIVGAPENTGKDAPMYLRGCREQIKTLADGMADMLAQDNPRFDRERFLKACGVE